MINKIARKLHGEEEGFTLIELMVVVLIIGILIAIALPTFLGARSRGQHKQAQSSLRNELAAAKTCFTDKSTYVGCDVVATLQGIEPTLLPVGTAVSSNLPTTISVEATSASVFYLAAWSLGGTCFAIKDDVNSGTSYATVTGALITTCTATAAKAGAIVYAASW